MASVAWRQVRRRVLPSVWFQLVALCVLAAAISVASVEYAAWVPSADFVLVLIIGGYLLRPRQLFALYAVVSAALLWSHVQRLPAGINKGVLVVLVVVAGLMWVVARDRARLGLQGLAGENMLIDLRDRILRQGGIPALPDDDRVNRARNGPGRTARV